MKRRPLTHYTKEQRALMLERWSVPGIPFLGYMSHQYHVYNQLHLDSLGDTSVLGGCLIKRFTSIVFAGGTP